MTEDSYTIGHLASVTGCKVQTIRHYEKIGIMPAPRRTEGNQRRYGPAHVQRLAFIYHGRQLGFPLDTIRQLLSLADSPEQSCQTADRIARTQLVEVESRIRRLQSLKTELDRMIKQCEGGRIANCRVIEVLSDHSHCLSEDHLAPAGIERSAG